MESSVETYCVPVRNELTGEIRTISVDGTCYPDAQIAALHQVFHADGWRRACALADPASSQISA